MTVKQRFTAIIRKGKLEYVGVCLELNLAARGADLVEVEQNLRDAITSFLAAVEDQPDIVVEPIPVADLIEFLRDTQPDWLPETQLLHTLEVHEVPSYV